MIHLENLQIYVNQLFLFNYCSIQILYQHIAPKIYRERVSGVTQNKIEESKLVI